MLITSIRDPRNPDGFHKGAPGYYEWNTDNSEPPKKRDHTIILIHGFNNEPKRLASVYEEIERNLGKTTGKKKIAVEGFSWPSDGSVFKYLSDYRDAQISADKLVPIIHRIAGERGPVSLVAHSMGTVVAVRAMGRLFGVVSRLFLMGGDESVKTLSAQPSHVRRLCLNLYSPDDKIVGVLAKCLRPGKRIGEAFVDALDPFNGNWNASHETGEKIRHNHYKSEQKVWDFVRKVIEAVP